MTNWKDGRKREELRWEMMERRQEMDVAVVLSLLSSVKAYHLFLFKEKKDILKLNVDDVSSVTRKA